MDKYQKAAKLLNSRAPNVGGVQERLAYINPMEEEILKSIGGAGAVIIPEAGEQTTENPLNAPTTSGAGVAGDTEVPSYLFKFFKKTVMDDWLGIDDNKTLGIPHKTFIGGALKKVNDDILGNDSTKTFGISDATWEDALPFVVSAINPIAGLAYSGLDAVVENNWDGSDKNNLKREYAAKAAAAAKARADAMSEDDLANSRALAMDLISRGKAGLIDPADSEKLVTLLASPGDEAYIEGVSLGGQEIDPFPQRFRESGDFINDTINNTGSFAGDYLGSADQRMADFMPVLDAMKGMNLDAMSTLGSIYDQGPGGLESQYRGFQGDFDQLSALQKQLNLTTANSNQGFVNEVIRGGDMLGDSFRNAGELQSGLTNRAYDNLSQLEGIKRMENMERMGRYGDTARAQIGRNDELRGRFGDTRSALLDTIDEQATRYGGTRDASFGMADDVFGSRMGRASSFRDAQQGSAGFLRDTQMGGADRLRNAMLEEASTIKGAEFGAADRLRDAERLKAMVAGDNAELASNSKQRALNSAMVGQGSGTSSDMASSMIRAQLGQQRGDLLADAAIADATRRGDSEVDFASRLGRAGVTGAEIERGAENLYADTFGKSSNLYADTAGLSDISKSQDRGQAGVDYSGKLENNIRSSADLALAKQMEGVLDGDARVGFQNKMEGILDSDADKVGAEIGADRYQSLADLDPGARGIDAANADLQNRIRALGYGDQILNAYGANIGIDQGSLDDKRKLLSDITNMRLGNTSLIPSMGMQYAQLPASLLEASLAPMGPLVRNISPYTSTGQLAPPITTFTPNAPPSNEMKWYDYAMMAPQITNGIQSIGDLWNS